MNTLYEQALCEYLGIIPKYTCFARGENMVLKNYGTVLTVQSSLEAIS